ncbi:MAG TPA: helix-turn-helix transcriptional regulator [Nocardioidaceae bacterium]|nr:helix-turn-helix transcriptional regulator [Nocardioidaceae bacterium]
MPTFVADPGALRDRYLMLELPDLHAQVTAAMRTQPPAQRRQSAVQVFADWLAARVPPVPDDAHLANAMADLFDTRPDVLRLEEVAAGLAVSARTLQRLAKRYVGIAPAAMIRRRRLQEAAERLRSEPHSDLAAIAADLGYADHAHMTNDFRTVLDFTPSAYRRDAR